MQTNNTDPFWPDKARLVISVSMQMEAAAQPDSGAESPLPRIDPKYPDIAATKWYEYGFKEGLPRIFSMIRGSSKAERKRVEETKRQRWNIFDCFCSISLDKPPRLFYAELDEWPIRNQPG